MPVTESPAARFSLVAGGLAFALALIGALATQFLDSGQTVQVLRILFWVVSALAILGIVLGLVGGMRGSARTGLLLSVVTALLLAAFGSYSGFATTGGADSAPLGTAPATAPAP